MTPDRRTTRPTLRDGPTPAVTSEILFVVGARDVLWAFPTGRRLGASCLATPRWAPGNSAPRLPLCQV